MISVWETWNEFSGHMEYREDGGKVTSRWILEKEVGRMYGAGFWVCPLIDIYITDIEPSCFAKRELHTYLVYVLGMHSWKVLVRNPC
jgi:hypothetical protein